MSRVPPDLAIGIAAKQYMTLQNVVPDGVLEKVAYRRSEFLGTETAYARSGALVMNEHNAQELAVPATASGVVSTGFLRDGARPAFDFPGAWYQVGPLQLHLMQREDVPSPGRGIGPHFALYVPTETFHSNVDRLREAGVPIMIDPNQRESDGIWAAFIKDPDGNIIELTDMGPMG